MARLPYGYKGLRHETLGADILAVLDALTFPRAILGDSLTDHLANTTADQWYPIATLLEVLEVLESRVGLGGLRKTGRALFRRTHQTRVTEVAKSGRDIVYGIDGMYRFANRGIEIGGWQVAAFDATGALLDKTTPHHCALEEGILDAALTAVGSPSTVSQRQCFRKGADRCTYEIRPAAATSHWLSP